MKRKRWKEYFWSRSFCLLTTGGAPIEVIKNYIEHQYDHLVLVVKYRRQVMDDTISDYAKDMFVRLGKNYNISLIEWNHDMDHVHILFKAHPNRE
ncbi:hypothetical protein M493_07145 [Geobacillus genomosp. 3]|uniref:Transposase IS200-like domain-containing protein n=1 Tax=Geobacillus genomosp. 3 TaxID=1921421 RepID=S5YYE9_GEOG3|nr:hypothetical protein M493_07145 [Geobacillus genomosp. 3]